MVHVEGEKGNVRSKLPNEKIISNPVPALEMQKITAIFLYLLIIIRSAWVKLVQWR